MRNFLLPLLAWIALVFPFAGHAAPSARAWLESYYLDPQPARMPEAFQALSREGYFDRPGHVPIAVGFFGLLFAQNPDRVDRWLLELNELPLRHHRLLAAALWQAGHPLGADLMFALGENSPLRFEIQRLAGMRSRAVLQTPVLSPSSMNLQWGAFLATGDERHVVNILDAIGLNEPGLDAAAGAALARHAADHPRVLDICRAQLERQPDEVKGVLRAVVNDAVPARPPI